MKANDDIDEVEAQRAMMMVDMIYPMFLHAHPATSLTVLEMLCARVLVLRGVNPVHFAQQLAITYGEVKRKRETAAAVERVLVELRTEKEKT